MFAKLLALVWGLRDRLQLILALLRDDRIPLWQKVIPILAFVYVVSPFNFFSFLIPIDDFALVFLALDFMERVVDDKIVEQHQKAQTKKQ